MKCLMINEIIVVNYGQWWLVMDNDGQMMAMVILEKQKNLAEEMLKHGPLGAHIGWRMDDALSIPSLWK